MKGRVKARLRSRRGQGHKAPHALPFVPRPTLDRHTMAHLFCHGPVAPRLGAGNARRPRRCQALQNIRAKPLQRALPAGQRDGEGGSRRLSQKAACRRQHWPCVASGAAWAGASVVVRPPASRAPRAEAARQVDDFGHAARAAAGKHHNIGAALAAGDGSMGQPPVCASRTPGVEPQSMCVRLMGPRARAHPPTCAPASTPHACPGFE